MQTRIEEGKLLKNLHCIFLVQAKDHNQQEFVFWGGASHGLIPALNVSHSLNPTLFMSYVLQSDAHDAMVLATHIHTHTYTQPK